MTERERSMYPGSSQPEFASMLDGRLYPSLMAIPAPSDHGSVKICGVCGDRAKSLHFGGMACDSCKAFFRRSVQNEAYKHFRCAYEGHCQITMASRKCCQSCRFNKCVEIGMEKSWVMTEEERMQQLRIRQEKKRQKLEEEERRRGSQERRLKPHEPQLSQRHLYLSEDDVREIDGLIETLYRMYRKHPMPIPSQIPDSWNASCIVDLFINGITRSVSFLSELSHFRRLSTSDQKILMQNGVLAMVILRGAMVYESHGSFSLVATQREEKMARVWIDDIKTLCSPDLFENHSRFNATMKSLNLDEKTLVLLQMVVLFSSDNKGLSDPATVNSIQDHYTDLVRRYMSWRYGEENTRVLYPRMLHRLADLRTLTDAHNSHTVRFPSPEVGKVVERFSRMDINPYPMYPELMWRREHAMSHRHRSEIGEDRTGCRSERSAPQRSVSLPVYSSEYGRAPAGPSTPQGAEAAPFQQPAFPAGYGDACSGQSACSFVRDLSPQWTPGYLEPAIGTMAMWSGDQRSQRVPAGGGGFASQQEYDLNSLLGMESKMREGKRMKTEAVPPMMSPQMSSAHAHQPAEAMAASTASNFPSNGQQQMGSGPQHPTQLFPPFDVQQSCEHGQSHPFTDAAGYQGNYPQLQ